MPPTQLAKSLGSDFPKTNKIKKPKNKIEDRITPEIVIGLCGPIGSGVSFIANEMTNELAKFGYETKIIKMSIFLEKLCTHFDRDITSATPSDRIEILQDVGNMLRHLEGNEALAQLATSLIGTNRENETKEGQSGFQPRRLATLIDSLKNPAEVNWFRSMYKNMFYLTGILCPESERERRIKEAKAISDEIAMRIINKDKGVGQEKYGQMLPETLQLADFFIRNDSQNPASAKRTITRYLKILFGDPEITPTKHESTMFVAQSAAARSGCLARQVGAAILNSDGDIIATGCNDVPKAGGGLYSFEDGDLDHRCLKIGQQSCHSKLLQNKLVDNILIAINDIYGESSNNEKLKIGILREVSNLIEYSRAVHAEMDAITSVARQGLQGLKNSTLYCTTFPCHHCARHIVAAGISNVYYIEPYEKSLAYSLHSDSIQLDQQANDSNDKVKFLHFEGVAPKKYLELFQFKSRKDGISIKQVDQTKIKPKMAEPMDSPADYEAVVNEYLETKDHLAKSVVDYVKDSV